MLAWLPALAATAADTPQQQTTELDCRSSEAATIQHPLQPGRQVLRLTGVPAGALWQIDEAGIELRVTDLEAEHTTEVDIAGPPARLGRRIEPARDGQVLAIEGRPATSTLAIAGWLRLHCRPDAAMRALLACAGPEPAAPNDIVDIDAAGYCLARSLHATALLASRDHQPQTAEWLTRLTTALWQRIDQPAHEVAALVHRSEALWRLGRHEAALSTAQRAGTLARDAGVDYYLARADNQRCLSLRGLGQFELARTCVDALAPQFLALGEYSEAANALFNQAAMANEDSRPDRTRAALAQAHALPAQALSALVRGRLAHVEASLESNHGRVPRALALLERALRAFDEAGSSAWQSSTYLHAARLHAALGAWPEARLLAGSAVRLGTASAMPERDAAARLELARILAASGESAAALEQAQQALRLAEDSNPQTRLDIALLAWTLAPDGEHEQQVERLADEVAEWTPRLRFDLVHARARHALAAGEAERAQALLATDEAEPPDLHRQIEHERLRARIETALGDRQAARTRLQAAMQRLSALALEAGAPALRQMTGRRLLQLRAGWIDSIDAGELDDPAFVEVVAAIVLATDPGSLLRPRSSGHEREPTVDDAYDRALAQALSGQGDEHDLLQIQRSLWQRYGREHDSADPAFSARMSDPFEITRCANCEFLDHAAKNHLAEHDSIVLLYGLGEHQSVLISHHHGRWQAVLLADAATLQGHAATLLERVGERSTPLPAIESGARELARHLFPTSLPSAPDRLRILVDESLAAVPFGLLPWPGQEQPLLVTSRVSLVSAGFDSFAAKPATSAVGIDVLMSSAAIEFTAGPGLPMLVAAEHEAGWIDAATPPSIEVRHAALREALLLDRLRSEGTWLHVAGHGSVLGGLQGHAGLWSTAEPDDELGARFVSWLDLLERPLAASLVVLNACALGDTGAGVYGQASSFATALQAAGVDHVIAALWPVSDSAAALWIPTFYETLLAASPGHTVAIDPADALRAAQLRLRASRAFRHPFYWASLNHYTSL